MNSELDTFASVSLERLLGQAELQTRIDRKYVLDAGGLPTVLGSLQGRVQVLDIEGRRKFAYRSTYFDTPELDAFHLSGRGRRRRFKVRTRVYRHSGDLAGGEDQGPAGHHREGPAAL